MRVVAGRYRGRTLKAPRGQARTRPTSDRVREATFAMLGELAGESVLDLFAGTGALGIEALSRGAGRAAFVERDSLALRALRANLAALELAPSAAEVRAGDALAAVRAARRAGETYDLVFVDPPYGHARALEGAFSASLPPLLAPEARVVVESDRRSPLRLAMEPERERRYGDTLITIYRNLPSGPAEAARTEGRPAEDVAEQRRTERRRGRR